VAGCINVIITNPIWVVNTRIKLQKSQVNYTGTIQGLIKVGQEEGIKGLWSGVFPSLILASNPAIQFAAYERIKRIHLKTKRKSIKFS